MQVDVREDFCAVILIGKAHIPELHFAMELGQLLGVRGVGNVHRGVHNLHKALNTCHAPLELFCKFHNPADRGKQGVHIQQIRHELGRV